MTEAAKKIEEQPTKTNIQLLRELTDIAFYTDVPLYEQVDFNANDYARLTSLLRAEMKFDAYCPGCCKDATFEPKSGYNLNGYAFEDATTEGKVYTINFRCTRKDHELIYFLRIGKPHENSPIAKEKDQKEEARLQKVIRASASISSDANTASTQTIRAAYAKLRSISKIGQHPSLADMSLPEIKKYQSVLDAEKLKEFTRAIGLEAHGVGVGSFVYLRRIFETLIWQAHDAILEKDPAKTTTLKDFKKLKMEDKIEAVKAELPAFLIKNKTLYTILSKGIHELLEDECLTYFGTVRTGIELILDEKLLSKQKEDKIKAAEKEIGDLHQRLSKK